MGKGKLVAGIILLIIGVGLIPASFGMNNLLEQRMDESVGTSLFTVRENVLPITYDLAYADATPPALLAIKAAAIPDIPGVINGSTTNYAVRDVIYDLRTYIGETNATEWFFNDPSWTVNTDSNYSIQGISEYSGLGNLSFTPLAITRTYNKIRQTGHLGTGVMEYLSLYENAISDIPTRDAMTLLYNSTWDQIQNVSAYLQDYIFPQVPTLGGFPFAATSATAEDFFYMHWVNSTVVPGTWEIEVAGEDYEVWEYEQYDLGFTETYALWDTLNTSAPLNDEGIVLWYRSGTNATLATELTTLFNLNQTQYENLMLYFFNDDNREDIFGPIFEDIQPETIRNVAYDKFYLQWANGEILPENVSTISPLFKGFEMTFPPNSTGIDPDIAIDLWAINTPNGFVNSTGVHLWFELARATVPDAVLYNTLRTDFGLTVDQMDALLVWIMDFRSSAVDILYESQQLDYHPSDMARNLTYGTYIAAGIVGFIGLIFILTSLKKGR